MLALLVVGTYVRADEPTAAVDFVTSIQPLLSQYCAGCHNAQDREGGLVVEPYFDLLAGGKRGAVVVPGEPDRSRLVRVLEGQAEPAMPPEGSDRPPAEQVALLRRWVAEGARGPSGASPDPRRLVVPQIALRGAPRRPITSLAFSPDGKQLATGSYAEVRWIDPVDRELRGSWRGLPGNVTDLAYDPSGAWLAAAAGEPGVFGEALLWNVAESSLRGTLGKHRDSLYAVAASADRQWLATAGYDQVIQIWEVATGKERVTLTGHNGAVNDLAFHPGGNVLASASADRTAKLWDAASGARLETFGQALKELNALVFSPDGRWLVTGGADSRIRLYQLGEPLREGNSPLVVSRVAHQGAILQLAFSPDGQTLISTGEDRVVRLWKADDLTERANLGPQTDWPTALAVSADGKSVAVGRMDGSLSLYALADGKEIPPPKPELAQLEPRGVQRGVVSRVRVSGKHLATAIAVEFSVPGLTGNLLSVAESSVAMGERWIELTADASLARGAYELAVRGPGGTSGRLKLHVDDLPQQVETEPNDLVSTAMATTLPAGYWGALSAKGDVDRYRMTVRAGQTIVLDLAARSLGSKLDGLLTVYDAAGQVVASNNDFDGEADPLVAFSVPADGAYTVAVQDTQIAGSAEHYYRLSVGELPLVTGCFPLGVPAGRESRVRWLGYNLPDDAAVKVNPTAAGELELPLDSARFRSRRTFRVAVGGWPEVAEQEPHGGESEAQTVTVPVTVNGQITAAMAGSADTDLFRFEAQAGENWVLETEASRRGSPIDTKIEVLDAEGRPVERLVLVAARDSYVTFRPINSTINDVRLGNWEEMELNQYVYMQGEVTRLFRMPQGPDSGFLLYHRGGQRLAYFNTSSSVHAVDEACFIVEPQPAGSRPTATGLPVFPLYYVNDDDGWRRLGSDSYLQFTAPANGSYLVRVSDVRGQGGDRFAYRLTIRRPEPGFSVTLGGTNPTVFAGSGRALPLTVDRWDGFEGDVRVDVTGLPEGLHVATPVTVEAGHFQAASVLWAEAGAAAVDEAASQAIKVTAAAEINGATVTHDVNAIGLVRVAKQPKLIVRLEPSEVTLTAGQSVTARLVIERHGVTGPVNFTVENLPHGVIVDNIGLNGVLIPEGESQREIFLTARSWVTEQARPIFAVGAATGDASPPIVLRVSRAAGLAHANGAAAGGREPKH